MECSLIWFLRDTSGIAVLKLCIELGELRPVCIGYKWLKDFNDTGKILSPIKHENGYNSFWLLNRD